MKLPPADPGRGLKRHYSGYTKERNMKKVKRWRYYCEFCKKSGGSGGHISRHEKSCSLNPNRICNVCGKLLEVKQAPMRDLLCILPDADKYFYEDECGFISCDGLSDVVEIYMPILRDATNNCPACIMAALRQSNIPVPMVDSFNFTDEMASIWADINNANAENSYDRY